MNYFISLDWMFLMSLLLCSAVDIANNDNNNGYCLAVKLATIRKFSCNLTCFFFQGKTCNKMIQFEFSKKVISVWRQLRMASSTYACSLLEAKSILRWIFKTKPHLQKFTCLYHSDILTSILKHRFKCNKQIIWLLWSIIEK